MIDGGYDMKEKILSILPIFTSIFAALC